MEKFSNSAPWVFFTVLQIVRQWRRSDVFIVNFELILHLVLVFLLLTLNI